MRQLLAMFIKGAPMKLIIKTIIATFLLMLIAACSTSENYSQAGSTNSYPVGHLKITYTDAARSNRSIPCHIYYPGISAGNNADVAQGSFPVLVFGHGFIMADPDLYNYLWDSLASKGYICVFPTTEGGSLMPVPDHPEFGKDLAFLNLKLKQENTNASSPFYQKVADTSAIIGHSMGGKASVIACKDNAEVTTMINFAAALDDPPVGGTPVDVLKDYAPYVTVPSLIVSAEFDCVAPPDKNQVPLYDAVSAECKYYVMIKGGGHCYFASKAGSSLLKCETGEFRCRDKFEIDRAEQGIRILEVITPYLDFMLKGDSAGWVNFNNIIEENTKYTCQKACNINF